MKLIEAINNEKLIDKKIDRHIEFIRRYSARPTSRDDSFGGHEKEKIQENVQACLDLIAHREQLRRNITYTNLVSAVIVNEKTYSLHTLIQQRTKRRSSHHVDDGILPLKRKVWNSLDDHSAQLELEKIRSQMSKDSNLTIKVIHNYDIEKKDKELTLLDELEASIDSAIQIANTKLDLLEAPTTFTQTA